ncbi:hypothetical protein ES703_29374 [subsurface metagenome]
MVLISLVENERGGGGVSPGCLINLEKLTVFPSILGGVQVLSLSILRPIFFRLSESLSAGNSPILPAGKDTLPMRIRPLKKVPVAKMIAFPLYSIPV